MSAVVVFIQCLVSVICLVSDVQCLLSGACCMLSVLLCLVQPATVLSWPPGYCAILSLWLLCNLGAPLQRRVDAGGGEGEAGDIGHAPVYLGRGRVPQADQVHLDTQVPGGYSAVQIPEGYSAVQIPEGFSAVEVPEGFITIQLDIWMFRYFISSFLGTRPTE